MRWELEGLPACEPNGRNWFWHGEQVLALLDEHKPKVCVELGSYKGGSAIAAARVVEAWGGVVTGIDLWQPPGPTIDECLANVRRAGVANSVVLMQGSTHDLARSASHRRDWKRSIDYLYVDADHSYEGCRRDLEDWWPFLKVGGLIAGDDYDDPRWEVTRAWDAFERSYKQSFERQATPGSDPECTKLIWGVKR